MLRHADRTRLCRDRGCGPELCASADRLLGDRDARLRGVPAQDVVDVRVFPLAAVARSRTRRYFLKAVKWARKYGLRINLDLHSLPGGQNPWNHSGRVGPTGMLNGPMGLANAQRSLDYIRIIAEFIAQPQYRDVVVMFGITNEPRAPTIGQENIGR